MKKRILQLLILCMVGFNPIYASVGDFFEAEAFNDAEGAQAEVNAALSGGGNVGYIKNDRWIKFSGVVLDGSETRIDVLAGVKYPGSIEIRIGAADGTLIGTIPLTATAGDFSGYELFSSKLVSTTGTNDIYLIFKGENTGYLFNLDYFILSANKFEGEDFNATDGCTAETNAELSGGSNVGYIENGDWIMFDSISFNGIQSRISVSATGLGGDIEFRRDSADGALVATLEMTGSSDYQMFSTSSDVTGIFDLYLVFTGRSGYLMNIDYFEFGDNVPDFTLTLDVNLAGAGSIATSIPGPIYDSSTVVTLTASKNAGYEFDYWEDGIGSSISSANPLSITIERDSTIIAVFTTVNTYALELNVSNAQIDFTTALDTVAGKYIYNTGDNIELFVRPNIGFKFSHWEDGLGTQLSSSNPFTIKIISDTVISPIILSMGVTNPEDSLLAYYKFEGNVADSSKNSHNGTILGAPKFVNGKSGKALFFQDGDAVNTGIHFVPNGSFSVSFWFKAQQWDEKWGNVIIGDRGDKNADGDNIGFQLRHYDAVPADGGGRLAFSTRGVKTDKDGYATDMRYNGPLYPNIWNHMVLVYSKESFKKQVYVNNQLVVDGNITNPEEDYLPAAIYDKLFIGARNDASSATDQPEASFNGTIDEVKIYTTSIDADYVSNLYNSYFIDIPKVAYWKFDSTSKDIVYDDLGAMNGSIIDTVVRTSGYINGAISFNEIADSNYVIVEDNTSINMTDNSFSISALVKLDVSTVSDEINILFKGGTGVNTITAPFTNDTWETTGRWFSLAFKGQDLRFYIDDNTDKSQINVDATKYMKGDWVHIAAVRDRAEDSIKLYINGMLLGSILDITETSISTEGNPLIIGNNSAMNKAFPGQIDELIIINKALSAEEVSYLATDYSLDAFPLNDNINLASIMVNGATIPFFSIVKEYDVNIEAGTTTIGVIATPEDPNATVDYVSNADSCIITIIAEDGVTKDVYTLFFIYESNDATLSALTVSEGTLSPVFSSEVTTYSVELSKDINTITVSATATSEDATILGDGEITLLADQVDTIKVTVTANDEITAAIYTIIVSESKGSSVNASELSNTKAYISKDNLIIISELEIKKAEMIDISGRLVLSEKNLNRTSEISVSGLNSSIYFLVLYYQNNQIESFKLVK